MTLDLSNSWKNGTNSGKVRDVGPTGARIWKAGVAFVFIGGPVTSVSHFNGMENSQLSESCWTFSLRGTTENSQLKMSDTVKSLKTTSGLSWQELADILQVSRRSLHFWANGGRISAPNASRLFDLIARLDTSGIQDPSRMRNKLLSEVAIDRQQHEVLAIDLPLTSTLDASDSGHYFVEPRVTTRPIPKPASSR